jgi:hypothetical protein
MQIAHLAPTSILEAVIDDQQVQLCLANLTLEDPAYQKFYHHQLRRGRKVIMDTPAFERTELSLDDLLDAAQGLHPTQIILPDDMDDPKASVQLSKEAARRIWNWKWGTSLMAVPHGRTVEEYMLNAEQLSWIQGVQALGIQEEIEEMFGMERQEMARRMHQTFPQHHLHFNGVTEGLDELLATDVCGFVDTMDTGKFVVWGLNGIKVDPAFETPAYPGRRSLANSSLEYFAWKPPAADDPALSGFPDAIEIIRQNIEMWNTEVYA